MGFITEKIRSAISWRKPGIGGGGALRCPCHFLKDRKGDGHSQSLWFLKEELLAKSFYETSSQGRGVTLDSILKECIFHKSPPEMMKFIRFFFQRPHFFFRSEGSFEVLCVTVTTIGWALVPSVTWVLSSDQLGPLKN